MKSYRVTGPNIDAVVVVDGAGALVQPRPTPIRWEHIWTATELREKARRLGWRVEEMP